MSDKTRNFIVACALSFLVGAVVVAVAIGGRTSATANTVTTAPAHSEAWTTGYRAAYDYVKLGGDDPWYCLKPITDDSVPDVDVPDWAQGCKAGMAEASAN